MAVRNQRTSGLGAEVVSALPDGHDREAGAWQEGRLRTPPPISAISGSHGQKRLARRKRYALRRGLWKVSAERSLRACGRATRDGRVEIHRLTHEACPRATAKGLVSCGSVWSCPVCSAHIRQARAEDIAEAARRWDADGGGFLFLTLTLRHHRGEDLGTLLDGIGRAWQATVRGNPWKRKRDRLGIVGVIKSTEVTWGAANGWHPHLHLLLLTRRPLTADELADLDSWLYDRWAAAVTRQGLGRPDREHGSRLELVATGEGVGQYVAKLQDERSLSLEMARGDLKHGRTDRLLPFDVLACAADGESWAVALWREYEAAVKGRHAIQWSRGLRDLLGMGEEASDSDIVAEDLTSEETLLGVLDGDDWRSVCRAGLDAALLDAAEDRGWPGVERMVVVARTADPWRGAA